MIAFRIFACFFAVSSVVSSAFGAPVDSTEGTIQKRFESIFAGCTDDQETMIAAQVAIEETTYQLRRMGAGNDEALSFYKASFGKPTPARISTVTTNIRRTINNMYGQYRFNCKCKEDTATVPNLKNPFEIKICKRFWASDFSQSTPGAFSKVALLSSDIFRFKNTAGAADNSRGVNGVASYAKLHPDLAIHNADSYAFFTEKAWLD